jgi:hypothetical protein
MRHDFLYDINRPIKLNHNLANQNWNKMTGGGRRPAAGGGGEFKNRRRPASQGMMLGFIYLFGWHSDVI